MRRAHAFRIVEANERNLSGFYVIRIFYFEFTGR